MSSTDYSYFNFNNYAYSNFITAIDFGLLPQYSVNGIPLITYVLVGVTAVTLGYVTLMEYDIEPTEYEPEPEQPRVGGKKKKSKTVKRKK